MASEESYIQILSGQNLMPKIVHFGELLKTQSWRSNSVTRQVSFNKTKNDDNSQIQIRYFE